MTKIVMVFEDTPIPESDGGGVRTKVYVDMDQTEVDGVGGMALALVATMAGALQATELSMGNGDVEIEVPDNVIPFPTDGKVH